MLYRGIQHSNPILLFVLWIFFRRSDFHSLHQHIYVTGILNSGFYKIDFIFYQLLKTIEMSPAFICLSVDLSPVREYFADM